VVAGIGISALASSLVPVQLTELGAEHHLPELGHIDLVLLTNPRSESRPVVQALTSAVLASGPTGLFAPSTPAVDRDLRRVAPGTGTATA
jgi:hypothetical protein